MLSGGHWNGAPSIDGTPQYVNRMPPVVGLDASKRDQSGGPVARTSHGRVQHSEQGQIKQEWQVMSRKNPKRHDAPGTPVSAFTQSGAEALHGGFAPHS